MRVIGIYSIIISTSIVPLLFSCDLEEIHEEIPITFEKALGGASDAYGTSVQQTQDGGYILTGSTVSLGAEGDDVYLIKTDADGEIQFEKTFGGLGFLDDEGTSVKQTQDGGYIISGYTRSFGAEGEDVYLIKTDADGEIQFEKTFGGPSFDGGKSVQQTQDGGYIITGHIFLEVRRSEVYLIKTDADGEIEFEKTFGGTSDDYGYAVQQTQDGGYIITGFTFGARRYDVYLIKTDADGEIQFEKTFGDNYPSDVEFYDDYGYAVQQTQDGGYIITGSTWSFGAGESDVYLIKTDADGEIEFEKAFGGASHDEGRSVQQTQDGGYIITGSTSSLGAGESDVYLIKTDAFGDPKFTKTFGGADQDEGWSVQQTQDGGYIITGATSSSGSVHPQVYLIKTDANGIVY